MSASELVRDRDIVGEAVAGVVLTPDDYAKAIEERKQIPIRHVDHIGLACRDAAATRNFYEGVLGMPLVNTLVFDDPFREDGAKYCHFFFEMANGNYMAFFDHVAEFKDSDFEEKGGFHLHFAFEVDSDERVQDYRQRLEAAGIEVQYIDHAGMYHSLYFRDPNGLLLEVTYKPEGTAEFEAKARLVAAQIMDDWIRDRPQYAAAIATKAS
jgi:glyoxylase I family protein